MLPLWMNREGVKQKVESHEFVLALSLAFAHFRPRECIGIEADALGGPRCLFLSWQVDGGDNV
jgi:hypothetical protein